MTDQTPIRPRGDRSSGPPEVRPTSPPDVGSGGPVSTLTGRDAWLQERRTGYGASDVPTLVMGEQKAWHELHAIKLGILDDTDDSETMELGRLLEEPIARLVASRLGIQLVRVGTADRPRILRHPELPFVMATLDRREKRGGRPVEIKKWGWQTDEFGPEGSDIVPERMMLQVQQQLAVTGKPDARLGVLFAGSRLVTYRIGRDDGTIDDLLEMEIENWAFVARGEMPPWPGPAPERAEIRHDEIEPTPELASLVSEIWSLDTESKRLAAIVDQRKDRVRELLAAAGGTRGELDDGRRFSVSHRQNRDGVSTSWQKVAAGYRKRLIELGVPESEIDPIETALSIPKVGDRPLRVTVSDPK